MTETGTKKSFSQNYLKPVFLVFGAVNRNLLFFDPDKEKTINDEFEVKVIPSLHKGSGWKNVFGWNFLIPLIEILYNAGRTTKRNSIKTLYIEDPEVWPFNNFKTLVRGHFFSSLNDGWKKST